MATSTMHIEVVSAESHVVSADVAELYARSVEGEFGILPGHQPGVFALEIAPVTLKYEDGSTQRVAVHRGTLFVDQEGSIILLADIAELESEIDVERARRRKQQIEQQLSAEGDGDAVLQASLIKQNVRLQVVDQPADA
jgi:F-type H+-transporting ATPase subunit epsilon